MHAALAQLDALRRFALPVKADLPSLSEALPALRRMLEAEGVAFRIVGGVAVVHHGYARLTKDIDILVDGASLDGVDLAPHGFERLTPARLRHVASDVVVDLLRAGAASPRPGAPPYPDPRAVAGSASDPGVAALAPLLTLKLHARRGQDLADVVGLLKLQDDRRYLEVEAAQPPELRARLAELRRDALEELSFEKS